MIVTVKYGEQRRAMMSVRRKRLTGFGNDAPEFQNDWTVAEESASSAMAGEHEALDVVRFIHEHEPNQWEITFLSGEMIEVELT
jgi:hypothetical protein